MYSRIWIMCMSALLLVSSALSLKEANGQNDIWGEFKKYSSTPESNRYFQSVQQTMTRGELFFICKTNYGGLKHYDDCARLVGIVDRMYANVHTAGMDRAHTPEDISRQTFLSGDAAHKFLEGNKILPFYETCKKDQAKWDKAQKQNQGPPIKDIPPVEDPNAGTNNLHLRYFEIKAEKNKSTAIPYEGVVADGISSIAITIEVPPEAEIRRVSYTVNHGSLRKTSNPNSQAHTGNIELTDGKAVVYYHPPKYMNLSNVRQLMEGKRFNNGNEYFALYDLINLSVYNHEGESHKQFGVKVCPTPILFIHGFLGDKTTWQFMQKELGKHGYDGWCYDFKQGDQSIQAQSEYIPELINEIIRAYIYDNIKASKVNLICHSMGGLIARYYVKNFAGYANDVRKLIMVGTPNHGVSIAGKTAGGVASQSLYGYHQLAAHQLYENSSFMYFINRKENQGGHLRKDVQYGNIYVTPTDHITTDISAFLDGVQEYVIRDAKHSTAINTFISNAPSITEDRRVVNKLLKWLDDDILPVDIKGFRAQVIPTTKDNSYKTWIQTYDSYGALMPREQFKSATNLEPYSHIITGHNSSAIIYFYEGEKIMGGILVNPNSEIYIGRFIGSDIRADLKNGRFLFNSLGHMSESGRFRILAHKTGFHKQDGSPSLPEVVISNQSTIFTVNNDGNNIQVHSIEGNVKVDKPESEKSIVISDGQTAEVKEHTVSRSNGAVDEWWKDIDYRNLGLNSESAYISGTEWKIDKIPGDISNIEEVVTAELEKNSTPLGFARYLNNNYLLYIEDNPLNITAWNLKWYNNADELNNGITTMMEQGWTPVGMSFSDDNKFYLLYIQCDLKGVAWQLTESALDLSIVSNDISPYTKMGYLPMSISIYDGYYYTLLVQFPDIVDAKWKIEGYDDNNADIKKGIEKNVSSGMVPFGFLIEDDVVNVLYIGL